MKRECVIDGLCITSLLNKERLTTLKPQNRFLNLRLSASLAVPTEQTPKPIFARYLPTIFVEVCGIL